jgi:hypothetical protein
VQGSGRSLRGYSFTNATGMTEELCVGTCQAKGYAWAGVEYSQECEYQRSATVVFSTCGNPCSMLTLRTTGYCDSSLAAASSKVADSQCSMLCTGNKREYCGAGNLLSVYKSS